MRFFLTAAAAVASFATVEGQTDFQAIYHYAQIAESDVTTSVPWGPVNTNATGHCNENACLGSSCYDWATIDGLDATIKSVALPSALSVLEPAYDDILNGNTADGLAAIQDAVDTNDLVDFYETLETFACCDCDGCMRLANCYQDLEMSLAGVSCATIWEFLLPTVFTNQQLIDALNTLNAGGCYYCPMLQDELDDTVLDVEVMNTIYAADNIYDFRSWTPTSTTTTTTVMSTTTLPEETVAEEFCVDLGCGNAGVDCSCEVTCERDEDVTCCVDYADQSCQEICPTEVYNIDGENDDGLGERYSCDDIMNLYSLSDDEERFSCEDLERLYGLDCSGCFCAEAPADTTTTVTYSACSNENANCGFGWVEPMSCDALIDASRETLDQYPGPDYLSTHLTCASLEDLGCDCTGCECERQPECAGQVSYADTGAVEILCMGGYSCDFWVERLPGVTCEILEDDYGCNCNYCECNASVPISTPEPECRCEVEYQMESLNGDGTLQTVTCDDLSAWVEDDGLCCGVMEYAFEMDCSGCCCDAPTCETCTENTTTTSTTTTTTTTAECPGSPSYYVECEFDYECREGDEVIPTTDMHQSVYDCFWINNYLENPETCFPTSPIISCSSDADCTGADETCSDYGGTGYCSSCEPSIPGGETSSSTEEPCYYLDHVDPVTGIANPLYTAYDCVNDYESGVGCIYFDQDYTEMTESFCSISLESIECPNVPEICTCKAQWQYVGKCKNLLTGAPVTCGGGTREMNYTCLDNCVGECVSQSEVTQLGDDQFVNCQTDPCDADICEHDFVGDGFCDWTSDADFATFFFIDDESFDYNIAECDWDGGDCCAYTCQPDDQSSTTYSPGETRGNICAFGGGGCQRVDADAKVEAERIMADFSVGGITDPLECEDNGDGTFDCCVDMILYDDAGFGDTCLYGVTEYLCASQGNQCADPLAPNLFVTQNSSSL